MSELLWDARTILVSTAIQPAAFNGESGNPTDKASSKAPKLSTVDIWNYLTSLSGTNAGYFPGPAKIRCFDAEHFERSWINLPSQLGSGASYSVERRGVKILSADIPSGVVALKRLHLPSEGQTKTKSGTSTMLQQSLSTVLKELRILTHMPLKCHRNIVSLLGYVSTYVYVTQDTTSMDKLVVLQPRVPEISLVMEFASYGTLKDFLSSRRTQGDALDAMTKCQLMHDIASGLEALHACDVVHGDVKLENTLVFQEGGDNNKFIAKLSDFGHSIVDLDRDFGKGQQYLGSQLMNAPELRSSQKFSSYKDYSTIKDDVFFYKCDIYSYGLLVWEIIDDGNRYYKNIAVGVEDRDGLLNLLNALPKDDLLFQAVTSLRKHFSKEHQVLIKLVSSVLQSTLRDNASERLLIEDVVCIFRKQRDFVDPTETKGKKTWLQVLRFYPLLDAEIDGNVVAIEQGEPMPRMPLVVESDLITRLTAISSPETPLEQRRDALYDLALCTFAGLSKDEKYLDQGLSLLTEASLLGSVEALSISFRLHAALGKSLPQSLRDMDHSIAIIERTLANEDREMYFIKRVRLFEKLHQQEALQSQYCIFHKDRILLPNTLLQDLQFSITTEEPIYLDELECSPLTTIYGSESKPESLMLVAARLGLLSLIQFLSATFSSTRDTRIQLGSQINSMLTAACRGGHVNVVQYLLSQGAEPMNYRFGTPFHWLMMFSGEEKVSMVFQLLMNTPKARSCLKMKANIPKVGGQSYDFHVTPLEMALCVNSAQLLSHFLNLEDSVQGRNPVENIGWTKRTFRLAVSLNLSDLLPMIIPLELSYRQLRPSLLSDDTYHGLLEPKPDMGHLKLFGLAKPPHSMLPLLIHGPYLRAAIGDTIDYILQAEICSLNDEDPNGSTVLAHAIRFAPCDFGLDIMLSLLLREASLGGKAKSPGFIINLLSERHGHIPTITRALIEHGLLDLDINLLVTVIHSGNVDIAHTILTLGNSRGAFGVNDLFYDDGDLEDDVGVSPIFFAVSGAKSSRIVQLLLDFGADIDLQWEGRTPLQVAISLPECDADTIDLLIKHGASPCWNGMSVLHHAACSRAQVGGLHVLFHLLGHESLRSIVNEINQTSESFARVSPLYMACYNGNLGAANALLEAGADATLSVPGLPSPLEISIRVGRRPQLSLSWSDDISSKEAIYKWRLEVEDIIIALMNKSQPGHGMTPLHIAAQVGNYQHVVELVEKHGYSVTVVGQEKRLPISMVEDLNISGDDDTDYVEDVMRIRDFLSSKYADINSEKGTLEKTDGSLTQTDTTRRNSQNEQELDQMLSSFLDNLDLKANDIDCSAGDGTQSPSDRATDLSKLIQTLKTDLGDSHPKTLRAMTSLYKLYPTLEKPQEAEELHQQVLHSRESQSEKDDPDLWEVYLDHVFVLCKSGKVEESLSYATELVEKSRDIFTFCHPITLDASSRLAAVTYMKGNHDVAIQSLRVVLDGYHAIKSDQIYQDINHTLNLSGTTIILAIFLCGVQRYNEAQDLTDQVPVLLAVAEPKDFLKIFLDIMDNLAPCLVTHHRSEALEQLYVKVADTCVQRHGKQKSYCIEAALGRLSMHYQERNMWTHEGEALKRLVDHFKGTVGPDHIDTVGRIFDLATCLTNQSLWLEAGLLLTQALQSLEKRGSTSSGDDETRLALQIKTSLCNTLQKQNRMSESESYGRQAAAGCALHLGPSDDMTIVAEGELAMTLVLQDKADEAIEIQSRRVNSLVQKYGEVYFWTRNVVQSLCAALMRARRLYEAQVQAERCIRISRQLPETNDRIVSNALHTLATCKQLSGSICEAQELYIQSLELEKKFQGKYTQDVFTSSRSLCKLYIESGDHEKAEPLILEMLSEAEIIFPSEHLTEAMLIPTNFLGHICLATGRAEEAVVHFENALDMARRNYGDDSEKLADYTHHLVEAYLTLGYFQKALKPARNVLRHRREILGDSDDQTVEAKHTLCIIYASLFMWPEAERIQRELLKDLESMEQGEGDDNTGIVEDILLLKHSLAESCKKQGRYTDAEHFARSALDHEIKTNGNDSPEVIKAMINLSYILLDAGNLQEGENLSSAAYDTSLRHLPPTHEQTIDALSLRAYACYEQGRFDDAFVFQTAVMERNPSSIEELSFLMKLYAKLNLYPEAIDTGNRAIALAEQDGDGSVMMDIVETMVDLAEIHGTAGNWVEARSTGEAARALVEGLRVPGNYDRDAKYCSVLDMLKTVYTVLGEREAAVEIGLKLEVQENMRREGKRRGLSSLFR